MRTRMTVVLAVLGSAGVLPSRTWTSVQDEKERSHAAKWFVSGRVVEAGTGRPLSQIKVRVMIRRIPTGFMIYGGDQVETDVEGKFRSEVAAPGPYVVFATGREGPNRKDLSPPLPGPRFGQAFRPILIEDPKGETIECAITLGSAATVRARVTNEKGDPVPAARVFVLCDDASHPIQFMDSAETDEGGRAELAGLGEGAWRLLVSKDGTGVASVDLPSLKWGEKRDIEVKLGPSGDLYLGVHVPESRTDEHAFSFAMCEVYDDKGRLVSLGPLTQVASGVRSVDDLPRSKTEPACVFAGSYLPGRYSVVVRSPRADAGSAEAFLHHLIESSAEFSVEAGKETRVRVTLPIPLPAPR